MCTRKHQLRCPDLLGVRETSRGSTNKKSLIVSELPHVIYFLYKSRPCCYLNTNFVSPAPLMLQLQQVLLMATQEWLRNSHLMPLCSEFLQPPSYMAGMVVWRRAWALFLNTKQSFCTTRVENEEITISPVSFFRLAFTLLRKSVAAVFQCW